MAALHSKIASRLFLQFVLIAGFLLGIACWSPARAEPSRMPQPALLPHYSPLCDSNLVGCLDIDDFAAHAYAHLMVLPGTDQRDSAAVFPYGVTLGLFGRIAGGVATDFSFWQVDGQDRNQHGPLRLNLTGLLWPLLPLRQAPQMTQEEDGATHYRPARFLRIGVHYEHQLRVGPFDGPNSLGLLTDLAALRLVASRAIGPIELTASLGALYDWRGSFATSEAAIQIGFYLPFFRALKLYGEALGRGWPAYVKKGDDGVTPVLAALLSPDGVDPIRRQGVLGLGLSFRPQARVDLGVSVQMGLGGLAPSAVLVRVLVLSVGKTYQGRAATPIAQLAGDVTAEVAKAIRDYVASLPIDPQLDENCIIRDDDGSVMGTFGKPTKNGYYCEEDGFRVPIKHMLLRDKGKTRLCRSYENKQLRDCLLERHGSKWVPVRRPQLNGRCEMYDSDGTYLGRLGTPTPDGSRCRYPVEKNNGGYGKHTEYQDQPIGELFHTDADRSRVCVDAAMSRCFMKAPDGRRTLAVEDGERFTSAYVKRLEERAEKAGQTAKDAADGKITLTTVREEATEAAENAAKLAKDPKKAAEDAVAAIKRGLDEWEQKTPEEKQDAVAGAAADLTVEGLQTAATSGAGALLGGISKAEKVGETLGGAAKASKAGAAGGKRAGQGFTHAMKRDAKLENAAAHGGHTTCVGCGKKTVPSKQSRAGVKHSPDEDNVDHIIPKAKGGDGTPANAQVLCRGCNLKKGAK